MWQVQYSSDWLVVVSVSKNLLLRPYYIGIDKGPLKTFQVMCILQYFDRFYNLLT
jgi:hypothetical protein